MKMVMFICTLIIVIGAALFLVERYRFDRWLDEGHKIIGSDQSSSDQRALNDLPPLLQKYLDKVIIKKSSDSFVVFTQSGGFRMKPNEEMSEFSAKQYVSLLSPMFSWVAKMRMKGLRVTVCDRLINRQGDLQARFFHPFLWPRAPVKAS